LHWCSHAVATESDAARLFREGRALLVAGRLVQACPKLEQSQQLEPRLGTQLNIAFCQERLGKLRTAWSAFQEAASTARREGDLPRERFARARVDALAPRVPWLEVRAAVAEGSERLTLSLDGAKLAPRSWSQGLPVDPGPHVLIASQDGEEYWRTTVVLGESERASVNIPAAPGTAAAGTSNAVQAPAARAAIRFIYEVGAFVGLIVVDTKQSSPDDSPSSIQASVTDEDGARQTVSCDTALCDYPSIGSSAGFVAGVSGFVGYAATEHTGLGLRLLLGPRAGGGALVALGPSASFLLTEHLRVGPAVLFGTASHVKQDFVRIATPTGFNDVSSQLHGTLGFSMGVGAELGWTLTSSPTGSVILQFIPLYLYGSNGSAWSLPIGAAYRWN
jgi:hypothetical protein